ncbi:hypothetical protein B296_00010540 [Ensete ventricosum]|uniref:Secreted protein n=1 Tax=Ensete ventricosum TaxID=4639 RepID=A0A426ZMM3_ENSVE|nr:hypothetical protein B296_00010540 [Ensete ventricosum]
MYSRARSWWVILACADSQVCGWICPFRSQRGKATKLTLTGVAETTSHLKDMAFSTRTVAAAGFREAMQEEAGGRVENGVRTPPSMAVMLATKDDISRTACAQR